jgi:RHS repeat-associated protein
MTQAEKKILPKITLYPLFQRKISRKFQRKSIKMIKKAPAVAIHRENFCQKKFTGKEQDSETGLHYYGARYLDSRTGRWLSGDPAVSDYIPSAPVNEEARKRNGSLPGMGGVFNYVNLHVYHYAGNNPVKYTDPDGEIIETVWDIASIGMGVVSLAGNIKEGNTGAALLDAAGIVADTAAAIIPGVPGGAGAAIKATRAAAKAADGAIATGVAGTAKAANTAATKGKAGEAAVRSLYDIGSKPKKPILMNGKGRIPDGVTGTALSEVKNVKTQSLTRQLRDDIDYAKNNGLDMNLYINESAELSKPLKQAEKSGDINIIRYRIED